MSSHTLRLAAWLVMGGCYYGHTRTEQADSPFNKKQLIKTNWRQCGFSRIRMLERCSPLLTLASERPRPLVMRSYRVKSFEIKFEACIIALPVSHHPPMCLEMTRDWIRKEGACTSFATGRKLIDSTGLLFAFMYAPRRELIFGEDYRTLSIFDWNLRPGEDPKSNDST